MRATPGDGEEYTTPIHVCGDVPACRAPFFQERGMPRTSQKSTIMENVTALRSRAPHEVIAGSST